VNPNPLLAFLLSLFCPGLGHLYLNRKARAFLYGVAFFGSLFLAVVYFNLISEGGMPLLLLLLFALAVWGINLLDLLVHLLSARSRRQRQQQSAYYPPGPGYPPYSPYGSGTGAPAYEDTYSTTSTPQGDWPPPPAGGYGGYAGYPPSGASLPNDRFNTILLSIVPGLGHFHLGLMQRGLTFLVSFFGFFAVVCFIVLTSRVDGFLMFLIALPVIWLYSMFDAVQLVGRRERGERLADRSLFEDLELSRKEGKRSRTIATVLAVFPGAGHMYLGLQQRGLQLMGAFLLSIYIMDALYLSLFLFLIPLIWFYSLFDALQLISRYDRELLIDKPIVSGLMNYQKGLGIGLVALGGYYLFKRIVLPFMAQWFPDVINYWFNTYFNTIVVSFLLIAGGLHLLFGGKKGGRASGGMKH